MLNSYIKKMGWDICTVDKSINRKVGFKNIASNLTLKQICDIEGISAYSIDVEREKLPFGNESFDAVILTEVLEHTWHDPMFMLAEIRRVLKVGSGILIISTPNFLSFRNRIRFLFGSVPDGLPHPFEVISNRIKIGHDGHLRLYSWKEIKSLLNYMGFNGSFYFTNVDIEREVILSEIVQGKRKGGAKLENDSKNRILNRFIKSPKNYFRAIFASLLVFVEKTCPQLRQRIFVVAYKEGSTETVGSGSKFDSLK